MTSMRSSTAVKRTIRLANEQSLQWMESRQCHVLQLPSGSVQLNRPAASVLSLCDGARTREEIIHELFVRERDEALQIDVEEFLDTALLLGWVVEE